MAVFFRKDNPFMCDYGSCAGNEGALSFVITSHIDLKKKWWMLKHHHCRGDADVRLKMKVVNE